MQLANRGNNNNVLNQLVVIARQLGYDEDWAQQQLAVGRSHAAELVQNFYHQTRQAFLRMYERQQGHEANELQERNGIGPMECGWHTNDRGKCSQSNSPSEEPMAKRQHTEVEGGASEPAQGGLDSLTASGPIWTHFPNTQRTRLRYLSTIFVQDKANWIATQVPFGRGEYTTATTLASTGGGNATANNTESLGQAAGVNVGYDFSTPWLLQLRMTSPYNIIKSMGTLNSGASLSQPNWLGLFDHKYQYYITKETDWGVKLNFGQPRLITTGNQSGIMGFQQEHKLRIYWKYTNQDDPPTNMSYGAARVANETQFTDNQVNPATGQLTADLGTTQNVTGATITIPCSSDDYDRMHCWNVKEVSFSTTHSTSVKIGGKYKFGQCKMDMKTLLTTDAHGANTNPTAEGMSISGATPAFPEILSIIIVNDSATTPITGVQVPMAVQVDMSQQIDWADLRAAYKFPTINQSTVANNAYGDAQFFWRGAAYS